MKGDIFPATRHQFDTPFQQAVPRITVELEGSPTVVARSQSRTQDLSGETAVPP
jgi:hypothetical protein